MRKCFVLLPLMALFWMAGVQAHGPVRQKVSEEIVINAPADKVWAAIKDICSIEKWHPMVASCQAEGGNNKGGKRILKLQGGGEIVEEIKKYDDKNMNYAFKIKDMSAAKTIVHASQEIEVPVLPVANYAATIQVKKIDDNKTKVIWKGAFYRAYMNNNPPEEMNEEAGIKAVTELYKSGLESLKKMVETS